MHSFNWKQIVSNRMVQLFQNIFLAFLAAIIDLNELVEMLSIGTLLAYSIVVICVVLLRYEVADKVDDDEEELIEEGNLIFVV